MIRSNAVTRKQTEGLETQTVFYQQALVEYRAPLTEEEERALTRHS